MQGKNVIGIDLGATNVRGAVISNGVMGTIHSARIRSQGSMDEVLEDVFKLTDGLIVPGIDGIGIGVPSVVDVDTGVVYDVQYIPSWKEVPLKSLMEARYNLPVFVNNDANCFALGEFYFGKGQGTTNMIGLAVGTGIGAGLIINNRLYAGANCGAGEFGMVPYLDHCFEYYACGQFFTNVYQTDGQLVFERAQHGDQEAQEWYRQMGTHLGNTINMIMYTYDPSLIIMGGSLRHAYAYFEETMWAQIRQFAFTRSIDRLRIELSELENSAILGAAGLYFDAFGQ